MPSKFKSERNAANRRWYAKYKNRIKEGFKQAYKERVSTPKGHIDVLLNSAIVRARHNGIDYIPNLCEFIIAPSNCKYCSKIIDYSIGKGTDIGARDLSPSVDQLIPGDGYTLENTQIICRACNIKKQALSEEEFLRRNNFN